MSPLVTVIIPTFRDWTRLKICVAALSAQTVGAEALQIIVVDNDPRGDGPDYEMPEHVTVVVEPRPGSYAARNRAIAMAAGKILAFTDSDCVPSKCWLENAVAILNENPGARVTGPVQIFKTKNSGRLAYLYEFHTAFRQKENAAMGVCVTANLVVTRTTLEKVGLFDDRLMSGGDFEWNRRAKALGIPLIYDPEVLVAHPSRPSLDEIFRKKKRIARSDATQAFHSTLPYVWAQVRPPLKRLRTGRKFDGSLEIVGLLAISWTLNIYAAMQFLCVRVGFCSLTRA